MRVYEFLLEYIDLSKTEEIYGERLAKKIKYDDSVNDKSISEIIQGFIKADPTPHGKYVQWMIRTYINGRSSYSDSLNRMKQDVALFDKFKQQLPVDKRDINKIKSLAELEELIGLFKEQKTGKEEKKEYINKAKQETVIVYSGPKGKILVPKTEKASCFWGRGTKWCTASTTSDNKFKDYHEKGNLYIVILPDNKKYQIHLESGQITDDKNDEVSVEEFKTNYPWVIKKIIDTKDKDDIQKLVINHPQSLLFLENIPDEIITKLISKSPETLLYINNPSNELIKYSIDTEKKAKKTISTLLYVEDPSEEIIKYSVDADPYSISYVKYPSDNIIKYVIDTYGAHMIQYIVNSSPQMQIYAVKKDPSVYYSIPKMSKQVIEYYKKNYRS